MGSIVDNRILVDDAEGVVYDDLAGGAAGAADTEIFILGTQSQGYYSTTTRDGLLHDAGAVQDWAGNTFYIWFNSGVAGLLDTQENGGITVRFCDNVVTNYFEVNVGGSDTYSGGWVMFVVNIEEARRLALSSPSQGAVGGSVPNTASIQYVGVSTITSATMPRMVDNTWVDGMWRLPRSTPGIVVQGRETGVSPIRPYKWDDIVAAGDVSDPTKAWGTIKKENGIFIVNTPIQFGNNGSPTESVHDMEDNNVVVAWETSIVPDDFYGLTCVGDPAGTQRFVQGVNGSAGQGLTMLAASDGPRWFFEATDADLDEVGLFGCSFTHTTEVDLDNRVVDMLDSLLIDGQRLIHSRPASPESGGSFERNSIINAVPSKDSFAGKGAAASPSYIAGASAYGTGTALSVTHGLTLAADDLIVALVSVSASKATVPNVFTDNNGSPVVFDKEYEAASTPSFGADNSYAIFTHRVGDVSPEPATYAFTSAVSSAWGVQVLQIRGADVVDIWDVRPEDAPKTENIIDTTHYAPSFKPNTFNTLAIYFGTGENTRAYTTPTNGFTDTSLSGTDTVDHGMGTAYKQLATNDDIGITGMSIGAGNDSSAFMMTILGEGGQVPLSPSGKAYLWTSEPDLVADCTFQYSDDHAMAITRTGTFNFSGNQFTAQWIEANSPDGQGTTEAGIFNGVGPITLNVSGGGVTPTTRDAGAGLSPEAVTTINNNISVTITNLQPGTEVRVYPSQNFNSPNDLTEIGGVENTGSPSEFTFSAAAGQVVDIVVLNQDYVLPPANRVRDFVVPTSDTSFPVSQIIDRNYSNP